MKYHYYLHLILFCITSTSCDNRSYESKLISAWSNRTIVFPSNRVYTRYGKDTIQLTDQLEGTKILVYVNSSNCMSCKLNLGKWKEFHKEIQDSIQQEVPILFHISSESVKSIRRMLIENDCDFMVCIDSNDSINKLNKFPNNPRHSVFLLNEKNSVLLIGNPIHNDILKHLYIEQMRKQLLISKLQ
ncbi:MAG: redoxin domain-containing protein [Bacteroidales bacterium]|nr:redoxin domain-containing protein [Bacteroidales bacterium]